MQMHLIREGSLLPHIKNTTPPTIMFVKANAFAHSIRVVVSLRSQRTGSRALLAFVGGRGKYGVEFHMIEII